MKNLTVFGSVPEVIRRLETFLHFNKFKNVRVIPGKGEVQAEKHLFFWWRDYVQIRLQPYNNNIVNIELRVNPSHPHHTSSDEVKEQSLQNRIYFYL